MIDSPEVAGDYYQKIADRIAVGPEYVIKHQLLTLHIYRTRDLASASGSLSC